MQHQDSSHCGSPHSCVLLVTGPFAVREAFGRAASSMGCVLPGLPKTAHLGAASAAAARQCPETVQRTHVCMHDKGNVYRTWACGAAYHWDCRNSGATRKCSQSHYSKFKGKRAAWQFFNVSAIPIRQGLPRKSHGGGDKEGIGKVEVASRQRHRAKEQRSNSLPRLTTVTRTGLTAAQREQVATEV